ncbi:MAG: YidC/Oxa1 family membrane protein insertase [Candidatus Staskawiczbacteria bacterium]|nr:YidC/Oxa1 family membrane protein insertase [Candidatus Staskawiczbacteria bacterium]
MFQSIGNFFYVMLYQPLFNALVMLYNYIPGHDFGIAIIFLTLIIRFILYPLSIKAVHSQKSLQEVQPKILEVQKKYKDDKEKQAKEILALYKSEKINPFSGLFLALVQLPILIALYQVFWNGLKSKELSVLYSFIANPGQINPMFIHLLDLSKPNMILAILAGLTQYFQTKMMLPKKAKTNGQDKKADFSQAMQTQMLYFMPVFTVIILLGLPSALGLYWTISGIFSIIQQYLIFSAQGGPASGWKKSK